MFALARRLQRSSSCLQRTVNQFRPVRTDAGSSSPNRRRSKYAAVAMKKVDDKSEWWVVDGEMHEIGENVLPRERFVVPRENIPNKRRKQLRDQFMRRTRLVLKESEHEPWCKRYMELYNEMRENWERLYWDEGYSKKLAQDHANYESAEDDDEDFSPYRRRQPRADQMNIRQPRVNQMNIRQPRADQMNIRQPYADQMKDRGMGRNMQGNTWEKVSQIRDKFEYDRERRMRDKGMIQPPGISPSTLKDTFQRLIATD